MQTKDRIVDSAVKLFNAKGVSNTSIRDISGDMGISSGNFAYHFKNKEALLEYFYEHMYDEVKIDVQFSNDDGLPKFDKVMKEVTAFMSKYSFFYTDVVEIFRLCPKIKSDYARQYENRKAIYRSIIEHFIRRDLMHPPSHPALVDELTHIIWFTMTFWQAQKKILPAQSKEVQPNFIVRQVWQVLKPQLTETGLKELKKLNV